VGRAVSLDMGDRFVSPEEGLDRRSFLHKEKEEKVIVERGSALATNQRDRH